MIRKEATVGVWLDTRRPLKSGKFPPRVRVSFHLPSEGGKDEWEHFYISTGLELTKEEFKKAIAPSQRTEEAKRAAKTINEIITRANKLVKENPLCSREAFESLWYGEEKTKKTLRTVEDLFNDRIAELSVPDHTGKIPLGRKRNFESVLSALHRAGLAKTQIAAVDVAYCYSFEGFLAGGEDVRGAKEVTTIGSYQGILQNVCMYAWKVKNELSGDNYPFGSRKMGKYSIPSGDPDKRALSKEDRDRVLTLNVKDVPALANIPDAELHLDLFKLSYFAMGMSFVDMFNLKKSNIQGTNFSYYRAKLIKNVNKRPIRGVLLPGAQEILLKYKNSSPYVLGLKDEKMTQQQEFRFTNTLLAKVNKTLDLIEEHLNLPINLTTYVARHTAASTLLDSGASVKDISEALGHRSLAMTVKYLRDLDPKGREELYGKLEVSATKETAKGGSFKETLAKLGLTKEELLKQLLDAA